jgi:hypothetical protein
MNYQEGLLASKCHVASRTVLKADRSKLVVPFELPARL